MSVHISSAVWRHSKASGNTLLVLLSIADQANDGGWAWPAVAKKKPSARTSRSSIDERTRLSRSTVQRAISTLEQLGELEVFERPGHSHLYRVTLGAVDGVAPPEIPATESITPRGGQSDTPQPEIDGEQIDTPGVAGVTPVTVREPSVREERDPRGSLAVVDGICSYEGCDKEPGHSGQHRNPWWEALEQIFGYSIPAHQASRAGRLTARLREAGEPPDRLFDAAAWIIITWGPETLTINSLHEHYERATSPLAAMSDEDASDWAEQRRKALRRARVTGDGRGTVVGSLRQSKETTTG